MERCQFYRLKKKFRLFNYILKVYLYLLINYLCQENRKLMNIYDFFDVCMIKEDNKERDNLRK